MKKLRAPVGILTAFAFAFSLFLGAGCNQNSGTGSGSPAKPVETSAVKNSFREVTSQLDAGGNLYGYLSTEQWLAGLSDKISTWREFVNAIPNGNPEERRNILRVFDVIVSLVKHSGIEQVSGVGMSSIQRETGSYHTRFVLHHYPGQGDGYLWAMFGKASHPLNGQDLLPESTAVAAFWDFDLPLLWTVLDKEIGQSGIPNAKETLQKAPDGFAAATGLKLDEVLASLGNEYGLVITLNESNKISLPLPNQPLQVPEPGILLVIKVKNDLIFNRVQELLKDNPMVIKADQDGVKMLTMPVPLPLPMTLRPTIARSGDYLFVASTDALIVETLAVKAGKRPGLKSTEEFKKLSQGMPQAGNQFSFVSQKFGQAWADVQAQILESGPMAQSGRADFLKKLMAWHGPPIQTYNVAANGDEGWLTTGNGNQDPSRIVLLPLVVVPAMMAGLMLPALAKAKSKAQNINCINNLRQIEAAKQMWALENKKSADDTPTWDDLSSYLNSGRPRCPSGGTYQINKISEPPTCSIPGHALNLR